MNKPLLIGIGDFGADVIEGFVKSGGTADIITSREQLDVADVKESVHLRSFVHVALWRPHEALCDRVSEACFASSVPLFVSLLEGHSLVNLTLHPKGACYRCFRRRFLTHHKKPDWQSFLYDMYDANHAFGPTGYPRTAVALALGLLIEQSAAIDDASWYSTIDLLKLDATSSRIVGIHGCAHCGNHATATRGPERFTALALKELESIGLTPP
jgi:hypothetical protein